MKPSPSLQFACPLCETRYIKLVEFERHIVQRHLEHCYPWKCSRCIDVSAPSEDQIVQHIAARHHSDEKRDSICIIYKCDTDWITQLCDIVRRAVKPMTTG